MHAQEEKIKAMKMQNDKGSAYCDTKLWQLSQFCNFSLHNTGVLVHKLTYYESMCSDLLLA